MESKSDLRFSSWKMFVSLETHPSLMDQRIEIYLIDIVNTYTECFI